MKKNDQSSFCESSCENNCDNIVAKEKNPARAKKQKKELSLDEKIYNFLEKAEKVAIFFANRQKAKKKKANGNQGGAPRQDAIQKNTAKKPRPESHKARALHHRKNKIT